MTNISEYPTKSVWAAIGATDRLRNVSTIFYLQPEFDCYRITMLIPKFLSFESRPSQLKKFAVACCTQKNSDGTV